MEQPEHPALNCVPLTEVSGTSAQRQPVASEGNLASSAAFDAAFVVLVHEQRATVLQVAAALVGLADAEDAAQEAFTRGWLAQHALRDTTATRAWLVRITYNLCLDWQRGRFGTHRAHTEPLEYAEGERPLATLDADPGTSDAAAALDLRAAINHLDTDLRLVVLLRYYAGMDATEVGAALGIPSATVRTRLRRALAHLRERLHPAPETLVSPRGQSVKGEI